MVNALAILGVVMLALLLIDKHRGYQEAFCRERSIRCQIQKKLEGVRNHERGLKVAARRARYRKDQVKALKRVVEMLKNRAVKKRIEGLPG